MFSFHHVSLSVNNLDESINFYECFGFKQVFILDKANNDVKIAHLALGQAILELFSYPAPQNAPVSTQLLQTDLPRIGIKHFGLKVESIEDAYRYLLEKRFVKSLNIVDGKTGIRYFFIKDPDGIFLEIVEDRRSF